MTPDRDDLQKLTKFLESGIDFAEEKHPDLNPPCGIPGRSPFCCDPSMIHQ